MPDFTARGKSARSQRRRWQALVRDRSRAMAKFDRNGRWFKGGPFSARTVVVRRHQLNRVIVDAARSGTCDADTVQIVRSVAGFLNKCTSFAPDSGYGFLCLTCETGFNSTVAPEAILLSFPLKGGDATLATGICKPCAARHSDRELVEAECRHIGHGLHVAGTL